MKRRQFITLLGGAVALPLRPLPASAQQQATPVVGFLGNTSSDDALLITAAFRRGLGEAGLVEGRDLVIEYRWAQGRNDRMPALAGDLVGRQVTVIAAQGGAAAAAAKAATASIPIVFMIAADPVETGLVASLNRPGGNLTGVTTQNADVTPKRLEMLHELVPAASTMGLLINSRTPNTEIVARELQQAARSLGLQLRVLHANSDAEVETALATLGPLGVGALVISPDPFFTGRIEKIAALTVQYRVPAIYPNREFAAAGGLMSYGTSIADAYRQVGAYAGRIIKGERPADLPVQRATRLTLVINLKTAKAFGLTVPLSLHGRAEEVIE